MTDIEKLRQELKQATKPLSNEYWVKQNQLIYDMQNRSELERKQMIPTPQDMQRVFDL